MGATVDYLPPSQLEYARMSKPQRLAALLVMLGPDGAAEILRKLDPVELEVVTAEMTRLPLITQELQQEVLREFTAVALRASTAVCGGVEFAHAALERTMGPPRAADLLSRVVPHRPPVATLEGILDLEARPLSNLLKHEQPQTVALVISYLNPEKSSQVLAALPDPMRDQVVERLATLGPAPVEVVEGVAATLQRKLAGAKPLRQPSRSGGVKTAAEVMNALDRQASGQILRALEERNPELSQAIRNKMFTFEDLIRLDSASLQKVLREVDLRDLAVALKTAGEPLQKKLLSCISRRAAETVTEEMSFLGPVKAREVEAAKLKVIETLRRLETEGDIDLTEATAPAGHEALV